MSEQQNVISKSEPVVQEQTEAVVPEQPGSTPQDAAAKTPVEAMRVRLANADVTPSQAAALIALSQGLSLTEAAVAASVDRGTLFRWRHKDRNFIAVLNAWRRDQQSSTRDRLLTMSQTALAAVEMELHKGNGRLGLRVLDRLGSSQIGATEPIDPCEIFGKGISDDDAERFWEDLKESILAMPEVRRPGAAKIVREAMAIESMWGPHLLEGLTQRGTGKSLTEGQSQRAGAMIMAQVRMEEAIYGPAKIQGAL